MPVQILKRRRGSTPKVSELRKRITFILDAVGASGAELSVAFIGDDEMKRLNQSYRGVDRPTDVLAFSQPEGEFGSVAPEMLGDVVISIDTASRQARRAGHTLEKELDMLLTHGILHLVGYDHEKGAKEARKMRALERKILLTLGEADNISRRQE